jgi:hypothetical protein
MLSHVLDFHVFIRQLRVETLPFLYPYLYPAFDPVREHDKKILSVGADV